MTNLSFNKDTDMNINHEDQSISTESTEQSNSTESDGKPHKIKNSVKLNDTPTEGRPSTYLFIFVNPLSGDRKGSDLVSLSIQHFRLRKFPQVQVEIHNILDDEDRANGVKSIQLVEEKVNLGQVPPNPIPNDDNSSNSGTSKIERGILSEAVQNRQIHVWSAGGDGTVMSGTYTYIYIYKRGLTKNGIFSF